MTTNLKYSKIIKRPNHLSFYMNSSRLIIETYSTIRGTRFSVVLKLPKKMFVPEFDLNEEQKPIVFKGRIINKKKLSNDEMLELWNKAITSELLKIDVGSKIYPNGYPELEYKIISKTVKKNKNKKLETFFVCKINQVKFNPEKHSLHNFKKFCELSMSKIIKDFYKWS